MVSADVSPLLPHPQLQTQIPALFLFRSRQAPERRQEKDQRLYIFSFSSALLVIFVILICLIVHHIEQGVFILEIHHLRTVILQVHIEIAL